MFGFGEEKKPQRGGLHSSGRLWSAPEHGWWRSIDASMGHTHFRRIYGLFGSLSNRVGDPVGGACRPANAESMDGRLQATSSRTSPSPWG